MRRQKYKILILVITLFLLSTLTSACNQSVLETTDEVKAEMTTTTIQNTADNSAESEQDKDQVVETTKKQPAPTTKPTVHETTVRETTARETTVLATPSPNTKETTTAEETTTVEETTVKETTDEKASGPKHGDYTTKKQNDKNWHKLTISGQKHSNESIFFSINALNSSYSHEEEIGLLDLVSNIHYDLSLLPDTKKEEFGFDVDVWIYVEGNVSDVAMKLDDSNVSMWPLHPTYSVQEWLDEIFRITNEYRISHGLDSYKSAPAETWDVAALRAKDIMTEYSHTRPGGRHLNTAYEDLGYEVISYGENIFRAPEYLHEPESFVQAWIDSPGHRANILYDCEYFAVGVVINNNFIYGVQVFHY